MFLTDSSGYSNTSMFKKKQKASSTEKGTFVIHRVEMRDIDFRIDDAKKGKHYDLKLSATIENGDSTIQFDVDQKTTIHN